MREREKKKALLIRKKREEMKDIRIDKIMLTITGVLMLGMWVAALWNGVNMVLALFLWGIYEKLSDEVKNEDARREAQEGRA